MNSVALLTLVSLIWIPSEKRPGLIAFMVFCFPRLRHAPRPLFLNLRALFSDTLSLGGSFLLQGLGV